MHRTKSNGAASTFNLDPSNTHHSIATHEAGHAVIALMNGVSVQRAVVTKRNIEGYVDRDDIEARSWRAACVADTKIDLAGIAAESLLTGETPDFRFLCCYADFESGCDWAKARWEAARLKHDELYLTQMVCKVRRELWRHWGAVEAIAALLIARGRLGPLQIRQAFETAPVAPASRVPYMRPRPEPDNSPQHRVELPA